MIEEPPSPFGLLIDPERKISANWYQWLQKLVSKINTELAAIVASIAAIVASIAALPVGRELLTAARTYYVRADGSDANTGLVDSAGGAFLTIQKAVNVVATLDMSIYDVMINVGAGTYSENIILKRLVGSGVATITGTFTLSLGASTIGFLAEGVINWALSGAITITGGNQHIVVSNAGQLSISGIIFSTSSSQHIVVQRNSTIIIAGSYIISASVGFHWIMIEGGILRIPSAVTITLTGTPAWGTSFVEVNRLGLVVAFNATFSGAATGKRYNVIENGVIETNGSGVSFFPGNVAGTTATGGQYV